ncbi:MAG: DUF3305 domain-containing protein [Motiliproteus sp.]
MSHSDSIPANSAAALSGETQNVKSNGAQSSGARFTDAQSSDAQSTNGDVPPTEVRYWPLLVQLRRKTISRGLWEVDSWSLHSCDSDRDSDQRQSLSSVALPAVTDTDGSPCQDFCWSGLSLELFRDERAAYRFNLSAVDPRLFVICSEEDELMQPYLVTASQDEASSYMDGGEEDVYSVAMPEAIQCWIEGFIARHGEPELEVGKGKRRHHGRRKAKAGAGTNKIAATSQNTAAAPAEGANDV